MLTVGPVLKVNSSIVTDVSRSMMFVDELDGVSLGDWSGEGDPRGLGVLCGVPLRVGLQGSVPLRVELPGSPAKLEGLPRVYWAIQIFIISIFHF